MPTPASSETTTVRACRTVPLSGRSAPKDLNSWSRAGAARSPRPRPVAEPTRPTSRPSPTMEASTWAHYGREAAWSDVEVYVVQGHDGGFARAVGFADAPSGSYGGALASCAIGRDWPAGSESAHGIDDLASVGRPGSGISLSVPPFALAESQGPVPGPCGPPPPKRSSSGRPDALALA
jgi:hypothetical protein